MKALTYLTRLEKLKTAFGINQEISKGKLLKKLQNRRLTSVSQVIRLHDVLCFMYAYPDSNESFLTTKSMLDSFSKRSDLIAFKNKLINSGIAGTDIHYQFFWPMACWIADNWPEFFYILWDDIENEEKLLKIIPFMVTSSESGIFDEYDFDAKEWLNRLKNIKETEAEFFVLRLKQTYATDLEREAFHDDLNLNYTLQSSQTTPNISNSVFSKSRITFHKNALNTKRPALKSAIKNTDFKVKTPSTKDCNLLVSLARKTMLTHERDLDSFSYGNARDIKLIDFDDGYQIACIGMIPERRYLLHTTYGFLNMKNGLPIGYFQISSIFNYAEVAFNLFSPFRGAEASLIFTRNMSVAHKIFDVNSFVLDPYQLGHDNPDGLKSGVWWFYNKLGFKPMKVRIQKILRQELQKMKKNSSYRSNLTILNDLASDNMFYNLNDNEKDYHVLGNIGYVSIAISQHLASRYGARREFGLNICLKDTLAITGTKNKYNAMIQSEKIAWQRWSPLVSSLGKINKWTTKERKQLGEIISAKGQDDELVYLKKINNHRKLKNKILSTANKHTS
ncbi:MAG: hypothetical protein ACI9XC_000117 [Gammaproteobacteria bacterium]|jgi:hypothetical protein